MFVFSFLLLFGVVRIEPQPFCWLREVFPSAYAIRNLHCPCYYDRSNSTKLCCLRSDFLWRLLVLAWLVALYGHEILLDQTWFTVHEIRNCLFICLWILSCWDQNLIFRLGCGVRAWDWKLGCNLHVCLCLWVHLCLYYDIYLIFRADGWMIWSALFLTDGNLHIHKWTLSANW